MNWLTIERMIVITGAIILLAVIFHLLRCIAGIA